jgi:hypothetical protein
MNGRVIDHAKKPVLEHWPLLINKYAIELVAVKLLVNEF